MASLSRLGRLMRLNKVVTGSGKKLTYSNVHSLRAVSRNQRTIDLIRCSSTSAAPQDDVHHTITKDTERPVGEATKHEFQAETRMLLDIVARSLYSEKEVFIRELISNASDALEKLRYLRLSGDEEANKLIDANRELEIRISTDKQNRILTIQDNGIGMSKDELISHLGVIARSGSKAFLEQLKSKDGTADSSNIIGQFGVGFYSAFMVADGVEVYSRSSMEEQGFKWSSDGTGTYEVQPAEGVACGTKIVIHLKADCREFADEETVQRIINKYSNFVGSAIYLNGKKVNVAKPLWLSDPKSVTVQEHNEFYRFISNCSDTPRFILHYNTDAPLSIHALLYFPEGKPGLFEMSRETETSVALYSKKILIKSRTDNILPKWLRFVKGVVDSEDIPLNLSRELLQNSSLIRKLSSVLTSRVLKFLRDELAKRPEEYEKFYADYGSFIKEGIITNSNQWEKEDIAKLLLFESSHLEPGKKTTLDEYMSRVKEDKTIFYLAAPSRTLAESSPYYESLKMKQKEVLFCYEPYDELVLMQLQKVKGFSLVSVEKDMRDDKAANDLTNLGEDSLKRSEINELSDWIKKELSGKAVEVNATTRLENHPCVVTVDEMAAARHFIRTHGHQYSQDQRYGMLRPKFQINPKHPIIKKLHKLVTSDPHLAELLINQLFANSMVGAGLVDDPRVLLIPMNELLIKALEKH